MILTDSNTARVGATAVNAIASIANSLYNFHVLVATTISRVISGALGVVKSGPGDLTLSGNNTFTGGLTLQGTGAINLSHSNAAGTGTIFLKYASSSFVAKTLGISGGIAVANAINIDSTTGRESIVSSGTGDNSLTGGITITGAGTNSIVFANEQSSGNLTVSGVISGASYNNQISLRGTQAGNVGFLNGTVTLGSLTLLDNNGATSWTLNTAGSTWGQTLVRNTGNLILGVHNALATGARVSFDIATSTGGVDLNGYNQSVAGITSVTPTTGNGGRVVNNGSVDATLTLGSMAANRSYTGIIADGPTNKLALVMNSSTRTQTLNGTLSYTGSTSITAGTLIRTVGNATATFTPTTLSVSFAVAPNAGDTFRFYAGTTVQTYASVTLVGATGRTATYNSANSTLTIA